MKNINIKNSRIFLFFLIGGFVLFFQTAQADLDKKFRENFNKITHEQCFNSIDYSVDDISGFVIEEASEDEIPEWKCTSGKCKEYQQLVNCLFDDAFQQAVNKVNFDLKDYTGENFAGIIKDTDKIFNKDSCGDKKLSIIQNYQKERNFTTSCSAKHLTKSYSACRVTETVLNELCGYQNFLTAKARDYDSFSNEEEDYHATQLEMLTLFDAQADQYLQEIEKTKQAFLDTSFFYKNFIQNYRIKAWLSVINSRLEDASSDFLKIMKAIETFPAKFINASSLGS